MNPIRIDWTIVIFSITATLFGALSLYGGGGFGETLAIKHLIWLVLGIILMFLFTFVSYQLIGSYALIIFGVALFLLVITLIPGIGAKIKGARSWIRFFGMGFQPAELMKIAMVIMLAKYLTLKENQIAHIKELFLPFLLTIIPMTLIAIQPDLGYAVMMLPLSFILLFLGGANVPILAGLVVVGFSILFVPMFLEYHKYIITGEIVKLLELDHYNLSHAIKSLSFEVWRYAENAAKYASMTIGTTETEKAIVTLLKGDNLKLFFETADTARAAKSNFLRDFFANDRLIILLSISSFVIYGVLFFLQRFYFRQNAAKVATVASLILALSLSLSFLFRSFVSFKPHQVVRIVSFANPKEFPQGAGYQLNHSLITVGSGKITGKGIFQGDMTKGDVPFLPEWYNDFIFPVIGEQFGLVGTVTALLLLLGIVIRGVSIAWQSKDNFGALLAAGITSIFFLHIFINIGITLGMLPVTGIPLVFFSYGGSNLIVNFIALGILMNIHRKRLINV
ncbi:MAG: FtsW/RodA/SpoVE family cell cycle protein [Leptospirales bacterium]